MKERIQMLIKEKTYSAVICVICLITVCILFFPISKKHTVTTDYSEYSSIEAICEYATLRCFYHNTIAQVSKPSGTTKLLNDVLFWPFSDLTKTGFKQYWQEYDGIIEVGIDASKIQINEPDANGVISIFVPDATILNVNADPDSFSKPITEQGLFTTITPNEKIEAYAKAQSTMQEEAENDSKILKKAKENAKLLLKQFIINICKEMNIDYSIKWISNPL